ncbi:MAG: hypothetical protein ACRDTG_06985 [Pseudonocardiaceae bacterium]
MTRDVTEDMTRGRAPGLVRGMARELAQLPASHNCLIAGTTLITAAVVTATIAFGAAGLGVVLGVLIGGGLLAWTAYRPIVATYVYVGTLPIIAGIDRDTLIPLVRPNEALLTLLLAGACLGGYLRYCRGDAVAVGLHRLEVPVAAFLLASTVWPLTSLMLRVNTPLSSDLAAVLPVCKLVAIYLLVRFTVSTQDQLVRVLRLIVWPGSVVAVIAILQTLGFGPVLTLLTAVWSPTEAAGTIAARGGTTLSSPIATGDYIIFCLVLVIFAATRGVLDRRERLGLGFVLAAGVLASGQFSTWISAAVAAGLILWRFPELRHRVWRFLLILPIIFMIGAPAFFTRMGGFAGRGVPDSWQGRWDNLSNFYLPQFDWLGILIGVSPNPVLQASETWRDVIYLENGYLQFLWIGGVPLLLAFGWLSVVVLRRSKELMGEPQALGAVAAALWTVWCFLLVLTVIDPHLTMRGIGDILFVLLAIIMGRIGGDHHS